MTSSVAQKYNKMKWGIFLLVTLLSVGLVFVNSFFCYQKHQQGQSDNIQRYIDRAATSLARLVDSAVTINEDVNNLSGTRLIVDRTVGLVTDNGSLFFPDFFNKTSALIQCGVDKECDAPRLSDVERTRILLLQAKLPLIVNALPVGTAIQYSIGIGKSLVFINEATNQELTDFAYSAQSQGSVNLGAWLNVHDKVSFTSALEGVKPNSREQGQSQINFFLPGSYLRSTLALENIDGAVLLLNGSDQPIAQLDQSNVIDIVDTKLGESLSSSTSNSTKTYRALFSDNQLFGSPVIESKAVNGSPLSIVLGYRDLAMKQALSSAANEIIILLGALTVLYLVLSRVTQNTVIAPIAELLSYTEKVVDNKGSAIPEHYGDEWTHWFQRVSLFFEYSRKSSIELEETNQKLIDDITASKEQIRILDTEKQRDAYLLRSLIDAMPEAITFKDTDGAYIGCNRGAERVFGVKETDIVGKTNVEVNLANRKTKIADKDSIALEERKPVRHNETLTVKGRERTFAVLRLPFFARDGEILGLVAIWRDITSDQEQKKRLKQSERRYRLAMDAVEDGLVDWNLLNNSMVCSPAFYTQLGYEPEDLPLPVEYFFELIHDSDRAKVQHYFSEFIKKPEGAYAIEFRVVDKSGFVRWIQSRGKAVDNDITGRPTRLVGTHKDVTKQKENELTLLNAKNEAENASKVKSQFLANMSHEIRTPMNAIIGMLQLVGGTGLNERQNDYVFKAQNNAKSLMRIINDILDFSKVEAGKIELEKSVFSVDDLLSHVLNNNDYATSKDVEILVKAYGCSKLLVVGDEVRLGQILINLLSNAIKFTHKGIIELGCELVPYSNQFGKAGLHFWVKDTGIGIAEEKQSNLFDPFSQVDVSDTRQYGGTGLGLSIVKSLVELMGGSISFRSVEGEGSEFSFTLMMDRPQQSDQSEPTTLTKIGASRKALVIEAREAVREVYQRYLAEFGFDVSTALSHGEAVLQLDKFEPDFMVVGSFSIPPYADEWGEQAETLYRQAEQMQCRVVAGVPRADTDLITEAGHHSHELVTLPFTEGELHKHIERALAVGLQLELNQDLSVVASSETADDKDSEAMPMKGHILLVDDNIINQQIACELLKGIGFDVKIASNGQEAVAMVEHSSDFDLVLMDIQMPVMDGLTATKVIREKGFTLPIIAMTANAMVGDKERSLQAGMNDHVTKPVDLVKLTAAIEKQLEREDS